MKKAFTLLELLLVIAIIASLAGLIINALNPAARLQEANDAKALANADDIESALKAYILDNGGQYPTSLQTYLNNGAKTVSICKSGQTCVGVDLTTELVSGGYLASIPVNTGYDTTTKSGYDIILSNNSLSVEGPALTSTLLFNDDFSTDDATPLTSPRTAEPGPGAWNITDTLNALSISNGGLVISSGGTGTSGNPILYGTQTITQQDGLASIISIRAGTGWMGFGWDVNQAYGYSGGHTIRFRSTTIDTPDSGFVLNVGTLQSGQNNTVVMINHSQGRNMNLLKQNNTWKILWVTNTQIPLNTNLYASFSAQAANVNHNINNFKVVKLTEPFSTEYGLATQRLAGNVASGTTFKHEADFVMQFTVNTIGSNTIIVRFREQDSSNYWYVSITNGGSLQLYEVVSGTPTQRGSASAVITNGSRIVLVVEGTVIRGYSDNALRWTYSSANNFSTNINGRLQSNGVTGSVSDIIVYPRILSGSAAAALDKAIE